MPDTHPKHFVSCVGLQFLPPESVTDIQIDPPASLLKKLHSAKSTQEDYKFQLSILRI